MHVVPQCIIFLQVVLESFGAMQSYVLSHDIYIRQSIYIARPCIDVARDVFIGSISCLI